MGNRLSNTEALTREKLVPGHTSRDVRKIGGGHIVRESRYTEDGPCESQERFVPAGGKNAGSKSLSDAIKTAKGG